MYSTFGAIDFLFPLLFIAVLAIILCTVVKGVKEWNDNNNAPLLNVAAKVIGKKRNTTHHNQPNAGDLSGAHGYSTITHTTYCIEFETKNLEHMEFVVDSDTYKSLSEGSEGTLSFQGTRFIAFRST